MAEEKLTKQQKKDLRKLEWQEKEKTEQRNTKIKKYGMWTGAILIVVLIILGLMWIVTSPTSTSTNQANIAPVSGKDITNGDSKAKVTLIEYADFECPACAAYHPLVNQLLTDYKGKIYYVYRMFPLETPHPNALISAQAGYAAYKQNAFFQMDDMLFNKQTEWATLSDPTTAFSDYAKLLKLDVNKFKADMNSSEAKNYVKNSENQALSEGINQTPTFFINGAEIQNPQSYNDFKKLIDQALAKK